MKSKKNILVKGILLVLISSCFIAIILTLLISAGIIGGAKTNESVDGVSVTQMYIDKNEELGIDWDTIIANLKELDMEGSGFYIDKENLEEDVKEFYMVTYTNYNPAVKNSFKEVDNQIMISYGIGTKNEFAYETPEFYDEPVFEIYILSNSSDRYYSAVYNEDKELLTEDGQWFLDTDKDETISGYLDNCLIAMGVLECGE